MASATAIVERHTGPILRPNLLVESTTLHILGIHMLVHTKNVSLHEALWLKAPSIHHK